MIALQDAVWEKELRPGVLMTGMRCAIAISPTLHAESIVKQFYFMIGPYHQNHIYVCFRAK